MKILFQLLIVSTMIMGFGKNPTFAQEIKLETIEYATNNGIPKTLFIAYPKNISQSRPAVVHIHGGGWKGGKASIGKAKNLAENGFIGISIHYRLSGEAIFPAAVHDCKTAIRWARANAEKYGINPDKIGVIGGSAGGHLAALIGTSGGNEYLEGDGGYKEFSSTVQAVVDNYGPTDFLRMNDKPGKIDHDSPDSPESLFIGSPIQQNPEQVKKANPITYIDPNDPPILMIHGKEDKMVIFNQSELLYEALKKAGVKSKLVSVENARHGFNPEPEDAIIKPSKKEIGEMQIAWFKEYLK